MMYKLLTVVHFHPWPAVHHHHAPQYTTLNDVSKWMWFLEYAVLLLYFC